MQLRPFQSECLAQLNLHKDVICIAPTGQGKSQIFIEWARQGGRRVFLISPLIALQNQQRKLLSEFEFRICSPESLLNRHAVREIGDWNPGIVVVDECHCIWEWGESFRPAFKIIPSIVKEWNPLCSLWLTATLPQAALEELKSQLRRPSVVGHFELCSNLTLDVLELPWPRRPDFLGSWISSVKTSGIIFVLTRENTERVGRLLKSAQPGLPIHSYHAGLSREERAAVEKAIKQETCVVISTSAFGLGMNIPELQWVILLQPFPTLLSNTQALGRVGRTNRRDSAILLWDSEDFRTLSWMGSGRDPEGYEREITAVKHFLVSKKCRSQVLAEYFNGAADATPCLRCDRCRRSNDRSDIVNV